MCLVGPGNLALAQTATPILVQVKVESPSLERAWSPMTEAIAEGLAEHVSEELGGHFRHWDFGHRLDRFYATLELRVVESARQKINIAFDRVRQDGARDTLWQEVWLKPTDFALGRRPNRDRAEDALKEVFEMLFAGARRQLVQDWLRKVPLGASGSWAGHNQIDTLRVVTSLPWQRFAALERSLLLISCRIQGNDFELHSRATDQPQPFQHPQSGSTYDALVLRPETIADRQLGPEDLPDLVQSDVRLIFLLEELEPVDDEFFTF